MEENIGKIIERLIAGVEEACSEIIGDCRAKAIAALLDAATDGFPMKDQDAVIGLGQLLVSFNDDIQERAGHIADLVSDLKKAMNQGEATA